MVNRKYCVRGSEWRKGEVQMVDDYGRSTFRKIQDKDFSYRDGPVHFCFAKKEEDIEEGIEPCFDEGRMWCMANNCSVFECNRVWWKKRKKRVLNDFNRYLKNKDEILKICFEMTYIESDKEFLFSLLKLAMLKNLLPWGKVFEKYEYEQLLEEGDIHYD